jgi:hypothetical protein
MALICNGYNYDGNGITGGSDCDGSVCGDRMWEESLSPEAFDEECFMNLLKEIINEEEIYSIICDINCDN